MLRGLQVVLYPIVPPLEARFKPQFCMSIFDVILGSHSRSDFPPNTYKSSFILLFGQIMSGLVVPFNLGANPASVPGSPKTEHKGGIGRTRIEKRGSGDHEGRNHGDLHGNNQPVSGDVSSEDAYGSGSSIGSMGSDIEEHEDDPFAGMEQDEQDGEAEDEEMSAG